MPCGKQPLVKSWDKPRDIRVIKPSRYEQNEASVKVHWHKVLRDLELSYKDEAFWSSQRDTVLELVGPKIFRRITKIFHLHLDENPYEPRSVTLSLEPSENYYLQTEEQESSSNDSLCSRKYQLAAPAKVFQVPLQPSFSTTDFDPSMYEEVAEEEAAIKESELWSISTGSSAELKRNSRSRSVLRSKSLSSKCISKSAFKVSRLRSKSISRHSKVFKSSPSLYDAPVSTMDDLKVLVSDMTMKQSLLRRSKKNPHFNMLCCNKSETDMIKWKSKYKQKTFEVSASDEFSKKAEIMAKKIAKEFYDWWVDLGNVEFKSEIKRPEDIEDLFQVWFDEHASRGLILDPRILPCVLQSIADSVGVKKASCPRVLKRQISSDIAAETKAARAHPSAGRRGRPREEEGPAAITWRPVPIPEDLKSMACVWDDVQHLTSTKAFHKWLQLRRNLPMPPFLKSLEASAEKKKPFMVPSDYVLKDKASAASVQDLALPVSEFSLELKEVLSKLLND